MFTPHHGIIVCLNKCSWCGYIIVDSYSFFIVALNCLLSEDGAIEGDGEGSETGKEDPAEASDDNSKSSDGSKDFEFVSKE